MTDEIWIVKVILSIFGIFDHIDVNKTWQSQTNMTQFYTSRNLTFKCFRMCHACRKMHFICRQHDKYFLVPCYFFCSDIGCSVTQNRLYFTVKKKKKKKGEVSARWKICYDTETINERQSRSFHGTERSSREFKAILVSTTPHVGVRSGEITPGIPRWFCRCGQRESVHLSCIFSRMGTIMSNLGLFAGSSFMHIFMSLQMWGEIPGGMVGLRPSKATWSPKHRLCCKSVIKPSSLLEVVNAAIFWRLDFCNSQTNLHANLHVGQVSKGHLSGHQLPQQDSKTPHVCRPAVDLLRFLLQGWTTSGSLYLLSYSLYFYNSICDDEAENSTLSCPTHHCRHCKVPWVVFTFRNEFMLQTSSDLMSFSEEISCRLHLALWQPRVPWNHQSRSSLLRFQLSLWICAVWATPTLWGHPSRRVHPAGTLEGELDICHADPGCHVFIYLWRHKTRDVTRCLFQWQGGITLLVKYSQQQDDLLVPLPWRSCCSDSGEGSWVRVCVRRPFHRRCPEQTSPPESGPPQSLTARWQRDINEGSVFVTYMDLHYRQ